MFAQRRFRSACSFAHRAYFGQPMRAFWIDKNAVSSCGHRRLWSDLEQNESWLTEVKLTPYRPPGVHLWRLLRKYVGLSRRYENKTAIQDSKGLLSAFKMAVLWLCGHLAERISPHNKILRGMRVQGFDKIHTVIRKEIRVCRRWPYWLTDQNHSTSHDNIQRDLSLVCKKAQTPSCLKRDAAAGKFQFSRCPSCNRFCWLTVTNSASGFERNVCTKYRQIFPIVPEDMQ